MKNCISVDLEEWFCGIENIPLSAWDRQPSRIEAQTHRLLSLFDRYSVKATFFVLGYIAERFPDLIKDINVSGHEIALHGYAHKPVYELSPEEFESDIKKGLACISAAVSAGVKGFRAPFFSITKDSLWALDVLSANGIEYDSSIYPVRTYAFGIKNAGRLPHVVNTVSNGKILEFPPSTARIMGRNIPFAGGFFLRFFPLVFIKNNIKKLNADGHPAMVYVHPFDIDPDIPVIRGMNPFKKFIHYHNPGSALRKTEALLKEFEFSDIGSSISGYTGS